MDIVSSNQPIFSIRKDLVHEMKLEQLPISIWMFQVHMVHMVIHQENKKIETGFEFELAT